MPGCLPRALHNRGRYVRQRFFVYAFAVSGMMISTLSYTCVSSAIKSMTVEAYDPSNELLNEHPCHSDSYQSLEKEQKYENIFWDKKLVGALIQSFYIGYIVLQVPMGLAADMVGAKWVWCAGLFLSSASTMLVPTLARLGPYAVLIALVLMSIGQSATMPCTSVLTANWVPVAERTTVTALIQSGRLSGIFVFLPFNHNIDLSLNWDVWIYFSGVIGFVWCAAWYRLFHDLPTQNPCISPAECTLIIAGTKGIQQRFQKEHRCKLSVPLTSIIMSAPLLSLLAINLASSWILTVILTREQHYLREVLGNSPSWSMNVEAATMWVLIISAIGHGLLSDWLIAHDHMSPTANRRLFCVVSNYCSIPLTLSIPFWNCDTFAVVLVFVILQYCVGAAIGPLFANPVDLSPHNAGLLMGFLNLSGAIARLFSRKMVFTKISSYEMKIPSAWKPYFWLTAAVILVFSTPFMFLGSGNIQQWNWKIPGKSPSTSFQETSDASDNLT